MYRLVDEHDRLWDKVKVSILQSMAFYRKGDIANAVMKLEAALQLAEPGKFIRSFLDEGAKMAQLLREYLLYRQHNSTRTVCERILALRQRIASIDEGHE